MADLGAGMGCNDANVNKRSGGVKRNNAVNSDFCLDSRGCLIILRGKARCVGSGSRVATEWRGHGAGMIRVYCCWMMDHWFRKSSL